MLGNKIKRYARRVAFSLFVFSATFMLAGCQAGTDAVIVHYPATLDQQPLCWFIHNQTVEMHSDGSISWHSPWSLFPVEYHTSGHTAHVLDGWGGRLNFNQEARNLGIDPQTCENVR